MVSSVGVTLIGLFLQIKLYPKILPNKRSVAKVWPHKVHQLFEFWERLFCKSEGGNGNAEILFVEIGVAGSAQNLRGSSHYSQRVCVIDSTPVIKLYNSKLEWNYFKCSAESFRNNRYERPQGWYCYNWLFMVFMTNILYIFEYLH